MSAIVDESVVFFVVVDLDVPFNDLRLLFAFGLIPNGADEQFEASGVRIPGIEHHLDGRPPERVEDRLGLIGVHQALLEHAGEEPLGVGPQFVGGAPRRVDPPRKGIAGPGPFHVCEFALRMSLLFEQKQDLVAGRSG
jgi:hypothetical protein